ncbi:sialate O-acetylesterase [Thermostilla marina]
MKRILYAVLVLAMMPAAPPLLWADVQPASIFTDNAVLQRDMPLPVWGKADPGEKVTVRIGDHSASTTAGADGRWMVKLDPLAAGGPVEVVIRGKNTVTLKNVLVGEVWICSGQSNMAFALINAHNGEEAVANSANENIRLYTVPRKAEPEPQETIDAAWQPCNPETSRYFSAVGYFFGKHLQEKLGVPVGLINTSVGGTPAEAWTCRAHLEATPEAAPILAAFDEAMKRYPEAMKQYEQRLQEYREKVKQLRAEGKPIPRAPGPPMGPHHTHSPAGLYNAMIAPLVPYAIRGAIWYQGESNSGRAYQYRALFPAMIRCWRTHWNEGDFPFLFVQLAPFRDIVDEPTESTWAELREAQLLTMLNVPNTGMAVITDVGEEHDIHPKKKQPVGDRLAIAARALAYGEKIEYSGPIYDHMEVQGNKAIVHFTHVDGGLECRGEKLTGFTICGPDRKFVNAQAKIEGDTVVVWAEGVDKPVAVRFGWADYPVVNLWNKAGLPASPFRTDDFPGITQNAQ